MMINVLFCVSERIEIFEEFAVVEKYRKVSKVNLESQDIWEV